MKNSLLLLSKNDIPFTQAQVNIHQPTIKEISIIGEESFHVGCQFLNFSINNLQPKDKVNLENNSNFEVFMTMMNNKEKNKFKVDTLLVLTLLFPEHQVKIEKDRIVLQRQDGFSSFINELNYENFKEIIASMFCLNEISKEENEYNPADALAAKIADKFKKRQALLAKKSGKNLSKIDIFSRYISILAVGEHKDMNELMEYTVYQLKDEFKRFQLKQDFDCYIKAKLAGAKDLEEVDNWMDDIHPNE